MAYDEGLAERVRDYFGDRPGVEEKKMFGGLCFMVADHMCCGILKDTLMVRVGPDNYEKYLLEPHAREMNFTGKPMKGMLFIDPSGVEDDRDLARWVSVCEKFVQSLPPK